MASSSYHPCSYNVSNIATTTRLPYFYYPNIFGINNDLYSDHWNSEHWNSDRWNSDHWNSDHRNSDHWNSDHWNSDHWNSDHFNSDHWNSDHWNSDHFNSDHFNSDHFNSSTWTADSDWSSYSPVPTLLQSNLSQKLSRVNTIAYLYITPIIIVIGIIGDILSVAVLSHPFLRKTSVVYSYLLALAVTDLLTMISVIPPILWIMKFRLCSFIAAKYYAHIGFPLANAFMGASVYVVVFLTFNQYMAVCHPFYRSDFIRSRRNCLILTLLAYCLSFALYVPWAWRKNVRYVGELHETLFRDCPYEACDNHEVIDTIWYKTYQWTREMISRFIPFLLIAYFNLRMLYVYRRTRAQRLDVVGLREQKMNLRQKTEREQRRLWALLFGIMTLFFVCTIPAAPFTIMVSDRLENNLTFQTIRAITNVLEFTKFALNFYLYCMINPDIRRLCLKRLTCNSSINALKAPMVASKNSYHLSDLLQMNERKNARLWTAQNQHRKSGAGSMTNSYEFKEKSKRSFRIKHDSERPLLNNVTSRRTTVVSTDMHPDSKTSPTCTLSGNQHSPTVATLKQNGSVIRGIQRSETDIILHDKPSLSKLSSCRIFNEESANTGTGT